MASMRVGGLRAAKQTAENILQSLCVDAKAEIGGIDFGGRVWVLPRWYLLALNENPSSIRVTYVEALKRVTGRPSMYRLATTFGFTNKSSGVTWTVGKGLIGYLTSRQDGFDVVQHDSAWPANVEHMTEKEWSKLDDSVTRSRSLTDVRSLRKMYATALGVSLADPDSGAALGCVTLHTKAGEPLTAAQADDVILMMFARMPELGRQIVSAAGLKLG